MVRKTKEEAEQTRKDILQAALNMFCEKGYTRTTFDDIAKSIGLTKGAIYWYFRNKPDILKALMLEDFQTKEKFLSTRIPEVKTFSDLKKYFMTIAEMVDNDANFRKFLFFMFYQMEWSIGLVNAFSDTIAEFRKRPQSIIENVLINAQQNKQISSSIDIPSATSTILAMWNGLLYRKIGKDLEGSTVEAVRYSFDLITDALLSRKD